MDVVVQPSVPWMTLNEEIKGSGLFFPVDPGPSVRCQLPWSHRGITDTSRRPELVVWLGPAAGNDSMG